MQTYDIIMILVLVGATIFGFWKGMAWQIASLASLVVSYFASLRFSADFAPYFGQQAPLNRFAAMLAIYSGTSLIIWTLFRFVSRAIDKVRLESFDKQLGATIGFAKGVLLCIGITFFAVTLAPQPQGQAIANSQSGHYIVALLDKAHSVFPPELHQVLDPYLNTIEQRLNPNYQPHGENLQQTWQNQVQNLKASLPAGMQNVPQIQWPSSSQPSQSGQSMPAWPTTTPAPQQQQMPAWPTQQPATAWPAQPRTAETYDPYGTQR